MKEKILEILKDYKNEFLIYYNKIKIKINNFFKELNFTFKIKENRKNYLMLIGIGIFLNLLIINMYFSYAYYNINSSFSILQASVGNLYDDKYDYVLLVYVQSEKSLNTENKEYYLTNQIPALGYRYSGYNCQNNSELYYNENTKITTVTTTHKDICSIYFDLENNSDLRLQIMLEENINSNKYVVNDNLPNFGYDYSYYECVNNSKLSYDNKLNNITLESFGQDYCQIYFKKIDNDI